MPPIPWKTLSSRYLVRDRWMTLRADRCETATGIVIDPYYVQEPEDWAQVVAFDAADRILVIRQYRHGAKSIFTELPCGGIEQGEPPERAAARELLEETGCVADTLKALSVMSPNPARYSNRIHTFIASGTRHVQQQQLDATEDIEFEFLPLPQVLSLIDSGSFSQALHVSGLFLALRGRGLIPTSIP
jgi:8-oxo-dGTP pyrophosphatase MutT (NUDIX family)